MLSSLQIIPRGSSTIYFWNEIVRKREQNRGEPLSIVKKQELLSWIGYNGPGLNDVCCAIMEFPVLSITGKSERYA